MKTGIALTIAVAGLILLALDRVLPKEKVLAFDEILSRFTRRFRPLDWKKLIFIFLLLMTVYQFYMLIHTAPSYAHVAVVVGSIGVVLAMAPIAWIVFGGLVAYKEWTKSKRSPFEIVVAFALATPLLMSLLIAVTIIKFCLYPVIYPLKGILVLNGRWFNSFSGLIGLVLAIVGTVLQFI